ncbi:MAG: hypothetical protein MUC48_23390 [Leptolyngbya sp. Prado105]|nr:hypothetical protein [Leptolyngbya sp. Prado105]
MTRQKRNSSALTTAQKRLAGMRSFSEELDFGANLNLVIYQAKIDTVQAKIADYNNLLGTLDKLSREIKESEIDLKDYSGKMLASVGARYGKTSWEYGQSGGKNSPKKPNSETSTPADSIVQPISERPASKPAMLGLN